MNPTLLIGTSNPSKIEIMRAILAALPVQIVSPAALGIDISVVEDGASCEENAAKKARAYHQASGLPTFAVDAGLAIAGLPEAEQPGMYVRRIRGQGRQAGTKPEANDQEMLEHYIAAIQRMGGSGTAHWTVGAALAARNGSEAPRLETSTYHFAARLVTQPSQVRLPGLPLSSLMIDPRTGRYFSEMDHRDREDAVYIRAIVQAYLEKAAAIP